MTPRQAKDVLDAMRNAPFQAYKSLIDQEVNHILKLAMDLDPDKSARKRDEFIGFVKHYPATHDRVVNDLIELAKQDENQTDTKESNS